jgi:hypothetical protein
LKKAERMFAWMKRRQSTARSQPEPDAASVERSLQAGRYVPLYMYLENRFANTVVLTFAEIEDLLGFTLPDLARQREDWWTRPDPQAARPRFSDAWILSNRTARPNLLALTVVFDRAL